MNASPRERSEAVNAGVQPERRVDTAVDYRWAGGQGQEQRTVPVVHQPHSSTSGGILANAAEAVTSTLQSAREAISGNGSTNSNNR